MQMYQTYAPEILCLLTQFILTIVSVIRINQNRSEFPIKQFGPASSILCAICFFAANTINFVGRIVKDQMQLKGICSMYESNLMLVLGVLYNLMRELPFALFAVKTLRVSLCFWPRFNQINVENLNKTFMNIMKNQTYFIYLSVVYVGIIIFLTAIPGVEETKAFFTFQFFCPKQVSIVDTCSSVIRFVILAIVFGLSIWTYQELDFIKFFFLLYAFSNLSMVVSNLSICLRLRNTQRSLMTLGSSLDFFQCQTEKPKNFCYSINFKHHEVEIFKTTTPLMGPKSIDPTQSWQDYIIPKAIFYFGQINPLINRLPIYYMSFVIEIFNTCIIIYYSGINKIFSQPAMQGVLKSWQAFHNLDLGRYLLMEYAIQKHSQYEGFHSRCLQSYGFLDELLIKMNVDKDCDYSDDFTNVKNILQKNQLVKHKIQESTRLDLCRKCDEGKLQIENVRKIERILSFHCENVLFSEWKRTKSFKKLREQFIRNGDINEKLGEFDISIS